MEKVDFSVIADSLEKSRNEMVELESVLTSIKALAPENGGEGEMKKCLALEKILRKYGIKNLERYDAPDKRVPCGVRPNLLATIPGKQEKCVWIMSHLDVVPEGDLKLWHTDPWTVTEKDGKIFGRGVEDDQQGIVTSVFAAIALLKNKITPEYTIKLLFVADEEVGSKYGISYLLSKFNLFKKDDLIIVPDGGDPKGETIEVAEKNILWLKFRTLGKQTHASRPDDGINAFLANCELALKLNLLETYFDDRTKMFDPDRSTFQPTKKEANVPNINTIPGEDIFYLDCRILPNYPLKEVRRQIMHCVQEIEKKYKVKITVTDEQSTESPATPVDSPVVQLLSDAIKKVYSKKAKPIGIGGGTVAAELRSKGFNAAVWSKIDEKCHQPDEYAVVDNLVSDAKVLAYVYIGGNC